MRLIDADKMIAKYCEQQCGCTRQECTLTYDYDGCEACVYVRDIEDEPTVDAEPVKHAYWLPWNVNCNQSIEFQCAGLNGCGCYVSYDHYTRFCDYEYCPHCGAKMDGGEQDAAD